MCLLRGNCRGGAWKRAANNNEPSSSNTCAEGAGEDYHADHNPDLGGKRSALPEALSRLWLQLWLYRPHNSNLMTLLF
jgi:hypothetical protein